MFQNSGCTGDCSSAVTEDPCPTPQPTIHPSVTVRILIKARGRFTESKGDAFGRGLLDARRGETARSLLSRKRELKSYSPTLSKTSRDAAENEPSLTRGLATQVKPADKPAHGRPHANADGVADGSAHGRAPCGNQPLR